MRAVCQRLNRVAVTLGEIPDVAGAEICHLTFTFRINDGDAGVPLQHKCPFGSDGVPMEFTYATGLQRHIHPGNAFGNRKRFDGGFSGLAVGQAAFFRLIGCLLLLDVLPDDRNRRITPTTCKVTRCPQNRFVVIALGDVLPVTAKQSAGYAFKTVDQIRYCELWRVIDQQMHVVAFAVHFNPFNIKISAYAGKVAA